MKRQLEEDKIGLEAVNTYARVHAAVLAGGTAHWSLNKKSKINSYLDARPFEPFCVQGEAKLGEARVLTVDGVGCGTLLSPLVDRLVAKAKPAPFGRKNKTVIDKTVRDALAIDASRIEVTKLERLNWSLIEEWCGVRKPTLYKLHIYGPGGHFEAHVDTPHAPGHIASAIVILGSAYEGGALVVEHGGVQERIEGTNKMAAWYTDCKHWVEPVTKGHRIVLQFDVIHALADQLVAEVVPAPNSAGKEASESSAHGYASDDSKDEEPGFHASRSWSADTLPATGLVRQRLVDAVLKKLERHDVALMLSHAYFNKGGLRVETLKGLDKLLWAMLQEKVASEETLVELRAVALRNGGDPENQKQEDFTVGGLGGTRSTRPVVLYPGSRDYSMTIFHAEGGLAGNSAMDEDAAYIAAAIVCLRPKKAAEEKKTPKKQS